MSAVEERLLSLEDVADRLQVSDQSVRRWIKAGKLAAYKPGLEWRIKPSDLEEFLETHSSPKVQAPLPSADEDLAGQRGPTENDFRHVAAIKGECSRIEAYLKMTASRTEPDEDDKVLLSAMLGRVMLVGELSPAVMEKESAHALLRPVALRFVHLGQQLVARAQEWELPAKDADEARSTVMHMQEWVEEQAS